MARDKQKKSDYMHAYFKRLREAALDEYMKEKGVSGCKVCGEYDPSFMDFHHVSPVNDAKARRVDPGRKGWRERAEGCMLLCANCHRRLHYYGRPHIGV